MKSSEVLDNAAKLLSKPWRWTQGKSFQAHAFRPAQYCMIGAVEMASSHSSFLVPMNYVHSLLFGESAAGFNDAPGRKRHEVVAVLRQAADLARAAGD